MFTNSSAIFKSNEWHYLRASWVMNRRNDVNEWVALQCIILCSFSTFLFGNFKLFLTILLKALANMFRLDSINCVLFNQKLKWRPISCFHGVWPAHIIDLWYSSYLRWCCSQRLPWPTVLWSSSDRWMRRQWMVRAVPHPVDKTQMRIQEGTAATKKRWKIRMKSSDKVTWSRSRLQKNRMWRTSNMHSHNPKRQTKANSNSNKLAKIIMEYLIRCHRRRWLPRLTSLLRSRERTPVPQSKKRKLRIKTMILRRQWKNSRKLNSSWKRSRPCSTVRIWTKSYRTNCRKCSSNRSRWGLSSTLT